MTTTNLDFEKRLTAFGGNISAAWAITLAEQ
jgi:hypothetical protein